MAKERLIINYVFNGEQISNPDGNFAAVMHNCKEVRGPGNTRLGEFNTALDFSENGYLVTEISQETIKPEKFCIRVLFNALQPVTSRQNLVECTALPFAIFLDKGSDNSNFNLIASVDNAYNGWTIAEAKYKNLNTQQWYIVDLVYDNDTLALIIDHEIISVTAFPNGKLNNGTGNRLYVGTSSDSTSFQFKGQIAAVLVFEDIPDFLENLLDSQRSKPEWHIIYKFNKVKEQINLGKKMGV